MPLGLLAVAAGVAAALLARAGDAAGVGGSPEFGWKQWALVACGAALVLGGTIAAAPVLRLVVRDQAAATFPARSPTTGGVRATAAVGIALAAVVLLWTRFGGITQSLWHDEAFSVLTYAQGGPRTILGSLDYVPNDHVLFNLLSWATVEAIGEAPANRRLWAVLPALAAVAAAGVWAWRRLGAGTALALVVLVMLSPAHLSLAKEARGYGLAFLCAAGLLVAADAVAHGGGRRALGVFALAGLAGIATLPIFAITFVMQAAPLIARRELRERVLLAVLVVGVASVGIYWSLLEDVIGNAGQEYGPLIPWHGVVTGPADTLLAPVAGLAVDRDPDPDLLWRVATVGPLLIGLMILARTGRRTLAVLIASPLLGTFAVLALARFHVETRFASYLLFYALVPIAVVLASAGAVLWRPRVMRPLAVTLALVVAVWATGHLLDVSRFETERPKEAFEEAALVVRGTGIRRVVSDTIRPEGLRYALRDRAFAPTPGSVLQELFCRGRAPFVFIEHPFVPMVPDRREPPTDTSCLVRRGAARVHLPQRERGGSIEVWIVTK